MKTIVIIIIGLFIISACAPTQGKVSCKPCPAEFVFFFDSDGLIQSVPPGYFDSGYLHMNLDTFAYYRVYGHLPGYLLTDEYKQRVITAFEKVDSLYKEIAEKIKPLIEKYQEQLRQEIEDAKIQRERDADQRMQRYFKNLEDGQVNPDINGEG